MGPGRPLIQARKESLNALAAWAWIRKIAILLIFLPHLPCALKKVNQHNEFLFSGLGTGNKNESRLGHRLTSALRSAFLLLRIDLVSLSPPTEESFIKSYIRDRLNRKEYVCKPE